MQVTVIDVKSEPTFDLKQEELMIDSKPIDEYEVFHCFVSVNFIIVVLVVSVTN